jgi:dihydrofolate reductase
MSPLRISLIVAHDLDGTIGDANGIPWRLPSDLARFKRITMGKPIIMGRTTYEHIGRALPGRLNIVLSRRQGFVAEGCTVAPNLDRALEIARESGADAAFVIGGAEVYREALPLASTLHRTLVRGHFPGNVRFPTEAVAPEEWVVESIEEQAADSRDPHASTYSLLRRA